MASIRHLPQWRLPRGVTRGTWDYAHDEAIARDYDADFAGNSLFEFDEAVLARHFARPGRIVDLGCGTGRLLMPFARRGFRGLAVDLSAEMLAIVGEKAAAEQLPIDRLLANVVELDCLADASADYAICMFSTLGMIRGHANRARMLRHVRRILRPGGLFILHVHNRWHNLSIREGRQWLAANLWSWLTGGEVEPGDKVFHYRGVPHMFLHVFTQTEITRLVRAAGFRIRELIPLDTERRHALRWPWLLGRLRANGWIIVCE